MTPEHQASLHNAREGDFVLVEQEQGYWYLLCINAFKLDNGEVRILIKSIHNPTKKDIWKYQQYGSWKFRSESWSRDSYDVRAVLRKTDVVTLRPEVEVLKRKLGCTCLYEHCDRGLVQMTPATQLDVHFRGSIERTQAHRLRQTLRSLCPFCMGQTLCEQHEHLATNPDRYPMDVYAQHLLALNRERQSLDYYPLESDTNLATLQPANLAPPPLNPTLAWNPGAHLKARDASTVNDIPAVSTHSFQWFQTAHERVMNDVCGICREAYAEGEVIADLPCQHFFHDGCVKEAFRSKGGVARCPLCQCLAARERSQSEEASQRPFEDAEVATRAWLAGIGN